MDDFLHNLRTGKNKMHDRKRRTYDNPNYRGPDRQGNRNRRPYHQNRDFSNETMTAIKKVLEEISFNQKKMADINNRRVAVEERKAEALEALVTYLKERPQSEMTVGASPVPVSPEPVAQPAPEAKPVVAVANQETIPPCHSGFESSGYHLPYQEASQDRPEL